MTQKPSPEKNPLSRSPGRLRRRVERLSGVVTRKLDDAICDIIDLGGFSLAVLLDRMPTLKPNIQKQIACRIEDFLFFHPARGRKVVSRLAAAIQSAHGDCEAHLLAALADVLGKSLKKFPLPGALAAISRRILDSDIDFMRKGKALEVISYLEDRNHIPAILKSVVLSLDHIDTFANFHFTETALFALKKLGGEGILRLLVNPQSSEGLRQFRLEWKNRSQDEERAILLELQKLGEHFSELILKVIELSEFNIPFLALIQEGLKHTDKWVRQIATASMSKVVNKDGLENLSRMLKDPSREVRMMAVNSLGNFPMALTGEMLRELASNEGENFDVRLNALYGLYSQKNIVALRSLTGAMLPSISLNAKGLVSLLLPATDGLNYFLESLTYVAVVSMTDLFHYGMELTRPEDLPRLISFYGTLTQEDRRLRFIEFLTAFLENKAGPTMQKVMAGLSEGERKALEILRLQKI